MEYLQSSKFILGIVVGGVLTYCVNEFTPKYSNVNECILEEVDKNYNKFTAKILVQSCNKLFKKPD